MTANEVIVVGAGVVGSAVAYGLARQGSRVRIIDGHGPDFRASRANFGLVWVQGKGSGMPAYQQLTRVSADAWPAFAAELTEVSGITVDHQQRGGIQFCLGDAEFEHRRDELDRLWDERRSDVAAIQMTPRNADAADHQMLDRAQLERLLPGTPLGPEVVGASHCWRDGYVNPLKLLHALHVGIGRFGGQLVYDAPVTELTALPGGGFAIEAGGQRHEAERVVVAAGLATQQLAARIGLRVPVRPERGQVLVTERVAPMLRLPASGICQTTEGTVTIGASQEDVGHNISTTVEAGARMAARACRILPSLRNIRVVRQWAGLRVLTPDKCPVYATSSSIQGAVGIACHSGVTLAAFHATRLAPALTDGQLPDGLNAFSAGRFDRSDDVPTRQ